MFTLGGTFETKPSTVGVTINPALAKTSEINSKLGLSYF